MNCRNNTKARVPSLLVSLFFPFQYFPPLQDASACRILPYWIELVRDSAQVIPGSVRCTRVIPFCVSLPPSPGGCSETETRYDLLMRLDFSDRLLTSLHHPWIRHQGGLWQQPVNVCTFFFLPLFLFRLFGLIFYSWTGCSLLHGSGAVPVVIKLLGRPDPARELGLSSPMRWMCL